MNRPTHIEAHYNLRRSVIFSDPDQGAQLIADSEARAIATQLEVVVILTRRWLNVEKERDQLRAEVERLKTCGVTELAAQNSSVADYCKHWEARAERAEAKETVALANWNGALERAMKAEADLIALAQCHDDNCRGVVKIADDLSTEREKAERYRLATLKLDGELASERARLDAGAILLTVAGERVLHCGVDLRAAIDAGIKEDAK
jgi:hypothetical protein